MLVCLRLPVASVDGVCVVAVAGDLAAACWLWESMWFVLNRAVCGGWSCVYLDRES